ncbi:HAD family phosphatase [Streptococcus thoraltensis]|uniref:HAD family hydrolase n=1 Tax=Streptococcus thoraltensis TaxID=55085 RepID=UPI000374D938|nr:HAD family phosphatase [Streptococcus thoraltensis]MDY4761201.1 HAD family phosphatase [Streptococcus thoraltensis]
MTIKAVIFDMDGVLFDTEIFYFERRKHFLAQRGISIDHLAPKDFIGGNVKQTWQLVLGDDYDKWDIPKLEEEYRRQKEEQPAPYPDLIMSGAKTVIDDLKASGYRLALASSSAILDIERALKGSGLYQAFEVILSGEDFPESKPHPAIYQEAITQLGLEKDQALVIEDSQKGIEAGKRAGLKVLALKDNRFGVDQSQADFSIDHLGQLFDFLD